MAGCVGAGSEVLDGRFGSIYGSGFESSSLIYLSENTSGNIWKHSSGIALTPGSIQENQFRINIERLALQKTTPPSTKCHQIHSLTLSLHHSQRQRQQPQPKQQQQPQPQTQPSQPSPPSSIPTSQPSPPKPPPQKSPGSTTPPYHQGQTLNPPVLSRRNSLWRN